MTENIPELEEEWSATRYPGWENGQIWVPSEEYTEEQGVSRITEGTAVK